MTCGETREYLFAFLDSELDAPLSIELQRHLDGCAHCAREAEIERTVRKQITSVMVTAPAEIPALDDMVGSMFPHDAAPIERIRPAHPIRIFHWGRLLAAAALALAVGASLWLALKDRPADSGVASLTDLVVADFEHFLEKGQPVQIESTDSDAVSVWLRERTAVAVVLPSGRACPRHWWPSLPSTGISRAWQKSTTTARRTGWTIVRATRSWPVGVPSCCTPL
jgi:anti-sigma factor RsiW